MAVILVSNELMKDEEIFETVLNSFDSFEDISNFEDRHYNRTRLRVLNDEVPKDDIILDPLLYRFDNIKPIIISYQ